MVSIFHLHATYVIYRVNLYGHAVGMWARCQSVGVQTGCKGAGGVWAGRRSMGVQTEYGRADGVWARRRSMGVLEYGHGRLRPQRIELQTEYRHAGVWAWKAAAAARRVADEAEN